MPDAIAGDNDGTARPSWGFSRHTRVRYSSLQSAPCRKQWRQPFHLPGILTAPRANPPVGTFSTHSTLPAVSDQMQIHKTPSPSHLCQALQLL